MKQKKIYLTNERFKYKFNSFFDLSNYGIKLAKERLAVEGTVTLSGVLEELANLPDTVEPHV